MMTPDEERLRDMWLSEMWRPVREYVAPIDPRQQAVEKGVEKMLKTVRRDAA